MENLENINREIESISKKMKIKNALLKAKDLLVSVYNKVKPKVIAEAKEWSFFCKWHWKQTIKPNAKKGKLFVENKAKELIAKAKPIIYNKIHLLFCGIEKIGLKVVGLCESQSEKYMKKYYAAKNVEVPLD